jgi:hypothetical protein
MSEIQLGIISLQGPSPKKVSDVFTDSDMMIVPILFWLLLLMCCVFAAIAGGQSGRAGSVMLIAASIATWFWELSSSWAQTHVPVMAIDFLLLIGLYILAIRSSSYWPIWAAGFHLLTVAGHFASIIMPDFRLGIYWRFSGIWSVLVLMAMVVGVSIDRSTWRHPSQAA